MAIVRFALSRISAWPMDWALRQALRGSIISLLLIATAPGSSAQTPCVGRASVVSADTATFLVQAPTGWILDCKSGKDDGPLTVLYRDGESWRDGKAVMYVSALTDRKARPMPTSRRIDDEVAEWRSRASDIKVTTLPPLATGRGVGPRAQVRRFESPSEQLFEIVAYVPRSRIMPILVMTARSVRAFNEALPAFQQFVSSYEPATLKVVP
jgi:hypothetical protein